MHFVHRLHYTQINFVSGGIKIQTKILIGHTMHEIDLYTRIYTVLEIIFLSVFFYNVYNYICSFYSLYIFLIFRPFIHYFSFYILSFFIFSFSNPFSNLFLLLFIIFFVFTFRLIIFTNRVFSFFFSLVFCYQRIYIFHVFFLLVNCYFPKPSWFLPIIITFAISFFVPTRLCLQVSKSSNICTYPLHRSAFISMLLATVWPRNH